MRENGMQYHETMRHSAKEQPKIIFKIMFDNFGEHLKAHIAVSQPLKIATKCTKLCHKYEANDTAAICRA